MRCRKDIGVCKGEKETYGEIGEIRGEKEKPLTFILCFENS